MYYYVSEGWLLRNEPAPEMEPDDSNSQAFAAGHGNLQFPSCRSEVCWSVRSQSAGQKYWVIDLGQKYEFAVVDEPSHNYLWILSRTFIA